MWVRDRQGPQWAERKPAPWRARPGQNLLRARSQVGIAVIPWLSPAKGLRPRGVRQSLGHSPCSPGSSFPEKLLMPLKSRGHRVPRASPLLPVPPSHHPQMRKRLRRGEVLGLGLHGQVAGTRPLNHCVGCRPADPWEWVGCIHLKFSVSCDVLTAEIPPGGQIPPPHLPRAQELPVTCANPLGRPGLCHLPCPRKGHSSAQVNPARCLAPQNTPKPR